MARKKNLTREDIEDVSIYEEELRQKKNSTNEQRVRLNDLSVKVKCIGHKQKELKKAIEDKDVVISTGPAGTGKTYVSLLTALHLMKTHPKYKRLVLVKSLQIIKGEDPGILPGTLKEKLDPYMYSFTGNLRKIFNSSFIINALMEQEVIEFVPIAYIRGVTIDDAIVIIDEVQNIDMHTFKTIITRIGKSCKMVFLGDVGQIDRKNKEESCLEKVCELFKDKEYTGSVVFNDEDSVRNPIIPELLKVLE
ncbi:MAG: PhoH family protein [Nanoarchaeota archaeon]